MEMARNNAVTIAASNGPHSSGVIGSNRIAIILPVFTLNQSPYIK